MSQLEISPELLHALQQVSSLLEPDAELEKTLQSVAELSAATIPGCDSAGITLRVDGRHTTAAASDAYALAIDKIQYEANEGPCVTALERSEFIQIDAVSEETRWPDFCERAAGQGFRSSLSFPLKNNGTSGALNVYAKTERAFSETAIAVGQLIASQAAAALQNARLFLAARHLSDELQEALKSRDVIGQAKGILIEREKVTDSDAFQMLKTISQSTNVKLRDVAQRLVEETVHHKDR